CDCDDHCLFLYEIPPYGHAPESIKYPPSCGHCADRSGRTYDYRICLLGRRPADHPSGSKLDDDCFICSLSVFNAEEKDESDCSHGCGRGFEDDTGTFDVIPPFLAFSFSQMPEYLAALSLY